MVAWGGGQAPYSIYLINATRLAQDPSNPVTASTHESLRNANNTDGGFGERDRYPVGEDMSTLVVDAQGATACTTPVLVLAIYPSVYYST